MESLSQTRDLLQPKIDLLSISGSEDPSLVEDFYQKAFCILSDNLKDQYKMGELLSDQI